MPSDHVPPAAGPRCIFVTGAGGFIGANLCAYLLGRGYDVIGLQHRDRSTWRLQDHPRLRRVVGDMRNPAGLATLLQVTQPDAIVNCAAYGAYAVQGEVAQTYAVNFDGLRQLLDAARKLPGLRAFVQIGTSSEYGVNCAAPTEEAALWPDSHYAVSKVAASALTRFYAVKYRLPAFVMRLYSVYGPLEDASRLIPTLLETAQRGQLPPLVSPQVSRDFIHVDDVCRALLALIERAPKLRFGDYFNIGSGHCTRFDQLVDTTCDLFDLRVTPRWGSLAPRHWDHQQDWFANAQHSQQALDWAAEIGLRQGLQTTAAWMQQHPATVAAAHDHSVVVP